MIGQTRTSLINSDNTWIPSLQKHTFYNWSW